MPCAYLAGLLHPLVKSQLVLVKHGFRWNPAVNGLFVPFADDSSVQLWDDDAACEAEIVRLVLGVVAGWRTMYAVMRRLCEAIRPEGEGDVAPCRYDLAGVRRPTVVLDRVVGGIV